jgi:serine/threonine protein kinase
MEAPPGEGYPEEDPLVGQLIADRYRVSRLLGEGGMGRVYEAEHVAIGKQVAVKVLHPQYSRHPDVVTRFRREAQAASKIGHPNIVDVTDFGETADGSVFFVMEHLAGLDLGQLLAAERCLAPERAIAIGVQICRALAAAHAAGIIHRDLKPENIFLIARDNTPDFVKVVDFGIAKSAEDNKVQRGRLTQPGLAMGTPEYMAPEQAAGKPIDHRVDIYALGTILYETITGRHPYTGLNVMEILTKKATEKPPPPSQLRPDLKLSAELEDVILRAMEKDPARRPATMGQLEYELNKCVKGRGMAVASLLGIDPQAAAAVASGGAALTPVSGVHQLNSEVLLRSGQSGSYPPAAHAVAIAAAAAGVTPPPSDDIRESGQRRIEEVLFERALEQGNRAVTAPPVEGGAAPMSGPAMARAVPPPAEGFNAAGATLLPPIQPASTRTTGNAASLIPPEPGDSAVKAAPKSGGGALRWVALVLLLGLGGGGFYLWQSGRLAPLMAAVTGSKPAPGGDAGAAPVAAPSKGDGGTADAGAVAATDGSRAAGDAAAAAADGAAGAAATANDGGAAPVDGGAVATADGGQKLAPAEAKAEIARLLGLAKKALKARRFVEPKDNSVATYLAQISAIDPANLDAAQLRSKVAKELHEKAEKAWKAKSWGKAQDAYRNVLSLAPDDKLGKERMAAASVKMGEKALDKRKSDEAFDHAKAALARMPDDVDALWLMARAELKRKNFAEAATIYGRILELQPSHADAQKALKAVQKRLKPQK